MNGSYENASQQRLVQVATALAGHELEGIPAPELAIQLDLPVSKLWRDLQNLRAAGWAEQLLPSSRWRLTPEFGGLSTKIARALAVFSERAERVRRQYLQEAM